MENIFVTEDLAIGYKNKAVLDNINLQIGWGKLIAVLGANGRGKSTFLKTLSGDIPMLSGKVELFGKELSKWSRKDISEKVASVWTDNLNTALLTAEEFIAFGRYPFINWMARMKKDDIILVEKAIELCNIEYIRKKNIQELSDGEVQKVLLARAISQNTELIILDEPTTHLDIKNSAEIFHLLKQLCVQHNKTILISTHKVESALQIADEIILISNSELMQGTAEDLISKGTFQKEFCSTYIGFDEKLKRFYLNNLK